MTTRRNHEKERDLGMMVAGYLLMSFILIFIILLNTYQITVMTKEIAGMKTEFIRMVSQDTYLNNIRDEIDKEMKALEEEPMP